MEWYYTCKLYKATKGTTALCHFRYFSSLLVYHKHFYRGGGLEWWGAMQVGGGEIGNSTLCAIKDSFGKSGHQCVC